MPRPCSALRFKVPDTRLHAGGCLRHDAGMTRSWMREAVTATSLPRRREPMERAATRRAKANPTRVTTGLPAHLPSVAWVSGSAGMTFLGGRDSPCARASARPLIPAPCARVASCAYRCLRRDVDGPIHRPRGNGRRPEGERNGSRSGRPGGNRFRRGASNGAEPATALAAQGAMAHAPGNGSGAGSQSCAPGHKSPRAGAERQPRDREVPGSPQQGSQGDLPESPGAVDRPRVAE